MKKQVKKYKEQAENNEKDSKTSKRKTSISTQDVIIKDLMINELQ